MILNLAATERMPDILGAWGGPYGVPSLIPKLEPLSLDDVPVRYDGIPLLDMTEPEEELFLKLTSSIGDGEAATLAIALNREAVPATDDKKALNLWARHSAGPVVGTPNLMDLWATATKPEPAELARAIRAIEQRARFRPAQRHPYFQRWQEMKGAC